QLDSQAPDYEAQVTRLREERDQFQLVDCKRRVDKYPTDLETRYELGQLYFQAGKISEAIQEFQRAQNNQHRRISAMNYLGQCFGRRNMNDLAVRAFQNALKEKPVMDDEKKDLTYNLACVYEKMNKPEDAMAQFLLIYEVDAGYRDVGPKVEAYYASKQSQSSRSRW